MTSKSSTLFRDKPRKPRKSTRFGSPSVIIDGIHYFPKDLKPSSKRPNKDWEIQAVYNDRGKLYQDTFYITTELKDQIINA